MCSYVSMCFKKNHKWLDKITSKQTCEVRKKPRRFKTLKFNYLQRKYPLVFYQFILSNHLQLFMSYYILRSYDWRCK